MNTIEVVHIAKTFGKTVAVRDVSFEAVGGEIFGMLGPNGAGKTTTIRIILDIFKPDRGSVSILGGAMNEQKKELIGYMPEERGLYQDITLEKCLLYLGSLKGMSRSEAMIRLEPLLERFDLEEHKKKKVKELSKGMQQEAQIINTIIHQPEVIIIDEPFTSLDPINTKLVKEVMRELRDKGMTIIMSTHQMHQVEELCDRILLINEGKDVLYGDLAGIRKSHAGNAVLVRTSGELPILPGVEATQTSNGNVKFILEEGMSPQDLLGLLSSQQVAVEKFEIAVPSLDEIFIRVVGEGSKV